MGQITITIDDEIEDILDIATRSRQYREYLKSEAYGMFIADLIREAHYVVAY